MYYFYHIYLGQAMCARPHVQHSVITTLDGALGHLVQQPVERLPTGHFLNKVFAADSKKTRSQ